MYAYF